VKSAKKKATKKRIWSLLRTLFFAIVFAAALTAFGMLKSLWTVGIIKETYQLCPKTKTYKTILPIGDTLWVNLDEPKNTLHI